MLFRSGKIIESERVLEAVKVDSEADKKFKTAVAETAKDKKADPENKEEYPGYPLRPGEKPPEK